MLRDPEKVPFWKNRYLLGTLFVMALVVAIIVGVFGIEEKNNQSFIAQKDQLIQKQNGEVNRLIIAYSKLRDQDFTLGITPAAPSVGQVMAGGPTAPIPLPKSFTAAFPGGLFTCTDQTGDGNYVCTVEETKPLPTSTIAPTPPTTH